MILETVVEKILYAFENAGRITAKNPSLPALANVLFLVKNNTAKIRSTNLSIGIEFDLPVKSESNGVVALDSKTICNFLNSLPKNEKIKISLSGTALTLTTKNNTTTIKTYPYEDFPTLPTVTGEEIEFPRNSFITGVKSVSFAAALSDIKPEIASICLISDKNTVYFVATDSFRLAEKKEELKKQIDFPQILIPSKNMVEIVRVLEGKNDTIKIIIGENQIACITDGVYITSKIISGSFPDYKQIIPKNFSTEVVVLKQDLINMIKSANVFSDKFNQINLTVATKKKRIECSAKNPDIGEYTGVIEGTIHGDDVSVSFNYTYLLDCLNSISQDSVVLGMNGSTKAIVVRGVSNGSFTYLLQPMNR